mmetsp:Transcript_66686/g.169086  ORF Transcript_66686/g.169086 Transcript_66686/m.169086 type:complete len:224 (-) Transcript_66686:52-723(-)
MGDAQSKPSDKQPLVIEPVTLNIYDIGTSPQIHILNQVLRMVGTGIFHCGVQVYGMEFSFIGRKEKGTGVFCCAPRQCEGHSFSEALTMGNTEMSEDEVNGMMCELATEWPASAYDLFQKNCCHFSDYLCQRLGVGAIPERVHRIADAGADMVRCTKQLDCRCVRSKRVDWQSGDKGILRNEVEEGETLHRDRRRRLAALAASADLVATSGSHAIPDKPWVSI